MKITVIGAGYVGLVTAACFAELGNEVLCVEKSEDKLNKLKDSKTPFYEPGIDEYLKRNSDNGRLVYTSSVEDGVKYADIIFLCVGTPQSENGQADLSQVEAVSREIAKYMNSYKLIIEKSTVPVNTHQWVKKTVNRYAKEKIDFDVASNPEFLREGSALNDFIKPDRIVVGVESPKAKEMLQMLYKPFTEKGCPLLITSPAEAELIKHASNSFLAMKISYANMLADMCENVGADVEMVTQGMGHDKRIGHSFLKAGIGYGGSCFPKDVQAFIKIADDHGLDFELLKAAEKINKNRRTKFVEKIENILWVNKEKKIAVWGLSFKPETDDVRESPAIDIIQELRRTGAHVRLYDPQAEVNFRKVVSESDNINYYGDKYDSLNDADALIILTEWCDFLDVDFDEIKKRMNLNIIIDGRNIYEPKKMKDMGFEYYCIGRC